MMEEISDVEEKELQDLVQRIAMHIVEGSSAVHELRGTVAKLKDHRSNLEYIVAQNWLAASKIIQEAGKNIASWENFINALRITYTDDLETSNPKLPKEYDKLLKESSEELWKQEITTHEENTISHKISIHGESADHPTFYTLHPYEASTKFNVLEYNVSDSNQHPQTDSEVALLPEGNPLFDNSGCNDGTGETQPITQVPLTTGEPSNFKPSNNNNRKRPLNWVTPNEFGGKHGKPKPRIQLSNRRDLDREHFLALKKSGRCFFCEEVGHRAFDCVENPDNMKFADQRFIYQGMGHRASEYHENPNHMQFAGHSASNYLENPDHMQFAGHHASNYPENPDHMQFVDQGFFYEGMGHPASRFPENPNYMMFPDHHPFGGGNS